MQFGFVQYLLVTVNVLGRGQWAGRIQFDSGNWKHPDLEQQKPQSSQIEINDRGATCLS